MTEVRTRHEKQDGEQVTYRTVLVEDAVGETYPHEFRATEDGHEYLDDGDAPPSALDALAPFEDGGDGE